MKYTPYNYQKFAFDHVINNPHSGLFKDMGLGKTAVALTATKYLMFDELEISKTLVIAPLFVADCTWTDEAEKWDHTKDLTFSKVLGPEKKRIAALRQQADIYLINRENVPWLVAHLGGAWPFDMVIVDESSSFKSAQSKRFKALKMVRPFIKRAVLLTGTPMPGSEMDLWSQLYLLDQGERLGKTITAYRERFFETDPYKPFPDYKLKGGKESSDGDRKGKSYYRDKIFNTIGDICISMKTEDWLDIPKRVDVDRLVHLSETVSQQYETFERDMILQLAEKELTAMNAGVLIGKLLQFANGAIYDENRKVHIVHDEKMNALVETLEEAQGSPMLVFYQYQHDKDRMLQACKAFKPRVFEGKKDLDDWNAGKIQMLIAHPASAGHGLNMQFGGHLCTWYGVGFNLEQYMQGVKRVHRQGVARSVINTRLLCKGTADMDALENLAGKHANQEALLKAVKARIAKYVGETVKI